MLKMHDLTAQILSLLCEEHSLSHRNYNMFYQTVPTVLTMWHSKRREGQSSNTVFPCFCHVSHTLRNWKLNVWSCLLTIPLEDCPYILRCVNS